MIQVRTRQLYPYSNQAQAGPLKPEKKENREKKIRGSGKNEPRVTKL